MQNTVMAKRKKSIDLEATILKLLETEKNQRTQSNRKRKQTKGCMLLAKPRRR